MGQTPSIMQSALQASKYRHLKGFWHCSQVVWSIVQSFNLNIRHRNQLLLRTTQRVIIPA